jgi:hypothetical protein
MKRTAHYFLGLSFILALSLTVVSSSFAKEDSNIRPNQLREEAKENIQERQEIREQRRSNTAQNHAERLSSRFGFYSQRLVNLTNKIKNRLEAMAADGKDVDTALAKINEAQDALDNAKLLGEKAVSEFSSIDPENYESQRDRALAAKTLADEAREEFKKAVSLMRESIKLAKDSIKEAE